VTLVKLSFCLIKPFGFLMYVAPLIVILLPYCDVNLCKLSFSFTSFCNVLPFLVTWYKIPSTDTCPCCLLIIIGFVFVIGLVLIKLKPVLLLL